VKTLVGGSATVAQQKDDGKKQHKLLPMLSVGNELNEQQQAAILDAIRQQEKHIDEEMVQLKRMIATEHGCVSIIVYLYDICCLVTLPRSHTMARLFMLDRR
jgi:hypothetical protein